MPEPGEIVKAPEVPFNSVLLKALRSVDSALAAKGNSPFVSAQHGVGIQNDGQVLVTVTNNDVVVVGKSFQDKLVSGQSTEATPDINQRLDNFLNGISNSLVRLNHVGINYFCDDMQQETQFLRSLAKTTATPLFEEQSSEPEERWLFLGNTADWQSPLVEIVLSEENKRQEMLWKPQFQIDVDTTLSIEEIKTLTNKHLGKGFVVWQLDVPDHGTVLAMGHLGKVGDANISLGIGTDKRETEYHRKNELKPL